LPLPTVSHIAPYWGRGDRYPDLVVHALEEHLTAEVDHTPPLGRLESANQGLISLLHVIVIEKIPEEAPILTINTNTPDVINQVPNLSADTGRDITRDV